MCGSEKASDDPSAGGGCVRACVVEAMRSGSRCLGGKLFAADVILRFRTQLAFLALASPGCTPF